MTLAEALDFLASNCPTIFAPIANEMELLRTENEAMRAELGVTQQAVNSIIMQTLCE